MTTESENLNPRTGPAWKAPWFEVTDSVHKAAIQKELALEIGPEHPLWRTDPCVLGARQDCDDVATKLADGRFAIVHPVWHGHVDQFPKQFPSTTILANLSELQFRIDRDAAEWNDQE